MSKKPLTLIDMRLDELLRKDLELTPLLINVVADAIVVWDRQGHLKEFVEKREEADTKSQLSEVQNP